MFYQEFGDSSINFSVRLWINNPDQSTYNRVLSEAVMQIKKAYDNNNITIPFPIRTFYFGIKGGTPINKISMQVNSVNEQ